MKLRSALIAHPFPIVVEALSVLAAGAGYTVARAADTAGVAAGLAAKPDLAVVAAGLGNEAALRARNGTTRTLIIADGGRDGAVALTVPVAELAAAITGADPRGAPSLTPRERDIARLVAAGQRNRAIGYALGISEGTVKMHLHNVYVKLGFESRTQLAMSAATLVAV